MATQPWISGPQELLQHGLSLLELDSDRNRRLSMIAIDNSVELMLKTFLGLPRRVSGLDISRRDLADASETFPKLLDAIERHAPDKLAGIDLGEIEWFHRLRNELYHQGNGLTVARTNVEVYAELARVLFANLFGVSVGKREEQDGEAHRLLGEFLAVWVEIEKTVDALYQKDQRVSSTLPERALPGMLAVRDLVVTKAIPNEVGGALDELRRLRNSIVHGQVDYHEALTQRVVAQARQVSTDLVTALTS